MARPKTLIYGKKGHPRRFSLSQVLAVRTVGDQQIMVYVFEDLSNDQLQDQFRHYLEREDYDYLAELKAEADLRGIKLEGILLTINQAKAILSLIQEEGHGNDVIDMKDQFYKLMEPIKKAYQTAVGCDQVLDKLDLQYRCDGLEKNVMTVIFHFKHKEA